MASVFMSNFTSVATGWQMASKASHYKHIQWLRADTEAVFVAFSACFINMVAGQHSVETMAVCVCV